MTPDRLEKAYLKVIQETKVPKFDQCDQYIYVVTRDTLIEIGIPLPRAERLARTHSGRARDRLKAIMRHL